MRGGITLYVLCAGAIYAGLPSYAAAQGAPYAGPRPTVMRGMRADYQDPPSGESIAVPGQREPRNSAGTYGSTSASDNGWGANDIEYPSDRCDDSIAGTCANCCAPCGLAGGVEATYLAANVEGESLGPPGNFGFEGAPRIWLQWQDPNCWGLRARYWEYDAQQQFNGAGDFGDALVAQTLDDDLEASAVDFEITRTFAVDEFDCWASFGLRHGRLRRRQNLQFTIFDVSGGGGDDATVIVQDIDRDFRGTGFTMALDTRRPFLHSRLAVVCNLRGSVIWGENDLSLNGTVIEVVPVGAGDLDVNDFQNLNFFGSNGQGMWIGEIQAGGEWNTPLAKSFGCGNAFIRLLFEAQWWHLPGVSAGEIVAGPQVNEFIGLTAAAGITR